MDEICSSHAVFLETRKLEIIQIYDHVDPVISDSCMSPMNELSDYIEISIRSNRSVTCRNTRCSSLKCFVRRGFSLQASSVPIACVCNQSKLIISLRQAPKRAEAFQAIYLLPANRH